MLSRQMKYVVLSLSWINIFWNFDAHASSSEQVDLNTAAISFVHVNQAAQITPEPTNVCPVFLISSSTALRAIHISNNSPFVNATNIRAKIPWEDVKQDAHECVSVPPGGTCNIYFKAGSQIHPSTQIDFSGDNTSKISTFLSVLKPLAIGDPWRGGLIYSINQDGSSGQVAATGLADGEDFWDPNVGTTIIGALDFGNGKANSAAIIHQLHDLQGQSRDNFAAGACFNYQSKDSCNTYVDWYLPAAYQLQQLMESNVDFDIFFGADTRFWTSTQSHINPTEAYSNYYLPFSVPPNPKVSIESDPKNASHVVPLCIRDFSYDADLNAPN